MFYDLHEITDAAKLAQKLFGPTNIYNTDSKCLKGVSIATKEYGKLWYGDLVVDDTFQENINLMSSTLKQRVYVIRNFDFAHPLRRSTHYIKD